MPVEKFVVLVGDPTKSQGIVEIEFASRGLVQLGRPEGVALRVKGHQTLIEQSVEMRTQ